MSRARARRVLGAPRAVGALLLSTYASAFFAGACGSETRGLVLGSAEFDADIEVDAAIVPPAVDAGCSNCGGGISLSGLSLTAQHGDNGGNPFTDLCPGNQVVIGYRGHLTDATQVGLVLVGQIETLCGDLVLGGPALDQVMVVAGATLPARGTSQASAWTRMCPPNQVVIGFSGRSGSSLDQVSFACAHWHVASVPSSGAIVSEVPAFLDPVGGNGGGAFDDGCPSGRMARGTNLRSGEWIDAFGLACGTPVLSPDSGAL